MGQGVSMDDFKVYAKEVENAEVAKALEEIVHWLRKHIQRGCNYTSLGYAQTYEIKTFPSKLLFQ